MCITSYILELNFLRFVCLTKVINGSPKKMKYLNQSLCFPQNLNIILEEFAIIKKIEIIFWKSLSPYVALAISDAFC